MIYFFDNELNIVKVTASKNVISAVHEHELNGLILGTVETDLDYTEAFIDDVDYFGYYYKDNYYLHKIKRVEHEHENELVRITGRHIFFEDMLYGDYIRDVRPENRDALYILNRTISVNTRWQTVMTDTSKLHTETYYWVPPMEVLNDLTENVGIEYEPKILFDGQKINGFQLHVANRIGEDTPIRVPFGSRVLNLKYEVDYSEIVTALYGHGKGEEVGDGYGRRINFSSVNFSRNGVVSPSGRLYMEDPNVTAQYGKDDGSPKFGRIIFEDIESASELADATYEAYLEQSRPKMLFEASVVDLGDVGMGDGVLIIRREHDVYFNARIHKLMVDLLDAENADVELGDYAHFKESKVQRKTRESNNQYKRETSSRIQQLKEQFNDRFDGEVNQMREDFEQALIDAHAEIQAAEQRMETLIEYERNIMTDEFNESVQEARNYAEQQAQEKAAAVRTDLETVTSGHQSMLDDLESNVMNIDDFIGDKTVGLNELLYNERMHMEERINSINTWQYNLLKETQTLESEFWEANNGEIVRSDSVSYFRKTGTTNISTLRSKQEMFFEAGETYTLTFEVQTFGHRRMDYIWILNRDTTVATGNYNLVAQADEQNAQVIYFGSEYRRYFITFTMQYDFYGVIQIGGNATNNEIGHSEYRIRKPYLTQSDNRNWLYHPDDDTQSIEEITRRITQLEDGREEFITRTQYDFETGEIEGELRHILETVDKSSSTIASHEDWLTTNGTNVLQTVDDVMSRAWLADIHNPNMIPHSDVTASENRRYWEGFRTNVIGTSYQDWARVRNTDSSTVLGYQTPEMAIEQGKEYTVSWLAWTDDAGFDMRFDYCYVMYPSTSNQSLSNPTRRDTGETIAGNTIYEYELTFVPDRSDDKVRFMFGGRTAATGIDTSFRMRHPKLELGDRATPYYNAYSMFSQRADEMQLAVQDTISQSDILIRPEYVQIGSQSIDGSDLGSLLRVSPDGIDAVAEAMRLSGDLYVDGDITAIAVDAIEGNFARLWAAEFEATTITADHIDTDTLEFSMFRGIDGLIDRLVVRRAFIDEMDALTLNAVYADLRSVNSEIMDTNILKADWIQGGNALLDKVFANTAMFERMMAKSAFVTTLSTITLDLHELTIWRPDGVAYVQNGVPKFSNPIDVKPWPSTSVEYDARNYTTSARGAQTFERAYCEHAGRYAIFEFQPSMRWDSQHASTLMYIIVRPSTVPSGVNLDAFYREEFIVYRDRSNSTVRFTVPLSAPTYGALSFTLEFGRVGDNTENFVQVRSNRCRISG